MRYHPAPLTTATSSLAPSRKTRFSSQPVDFAENFPPRSISEVDFALVGLEDAFRFACRHIFLPVEQFLRAVRRRLSLKNEKPRSQEKIRTVETSFDARKLSGGNTRRILRGLAYYVAASPDRLDVVLAAGCVGEFFPQLADEDIDDLHIRLVHAAIEVV